MTLTSSIIAKFTASTDKRIFCSCNGGGFVYVGTGPDGIVYRTKDGNSVDIFYKIDDSYARSVIYYSEALFVGSSPNGTIYMHNFSSGNRFKYVITGDREVTSFCVNKDILYAATSPNGMIFSFDGRSWKEEYKAFGGGVISMKSYKDVLYVFSEGVDFVPCFDGSQWYYMKNGDDKFSLSYISKAKLTKGGVGDPKKLSFGGADVSDKLYFFPKKSGNLYSFDGSVVSICGQIDSEILSLKCVDKNIFVSSSSGSVHRGEI